MAQALKAGSAYLVGGMDSYTLPSALTDREYVAGMNVTCRGGIVQTRPGTRSLSQVVGSAIRVQGFAAFTPTGGIPHLVAAVDGRIYVSQQPFDEVRQLTNLRFNPTSRYVVFETCLKSTDYTADGELIFLDRPYNVLMIQDGATRAAYWDGSSSGHLNPTPSGRTDENGEILTEPGFDETFIGLFMRWSGNRLWVARQGQIFASDFGNPMKFTEAQYINEGRSFYLTGECTGMIETPDQSGLIVFTADNGTLFKTSIQDRQLWLQTVDFQKVIFPDIGCVAPFSPIRQYGLIWWFSAQGLINSDQALALYRTSRIDYQDTEMMCSKGNLGPDLGGICTAAFENYLLVSVPSGDVYNRHTWCLDQSVLEDGAKAWDSYWTGWYPHQWATARMDGHERVFFLAKDDNGCVKIWEANQPDRTDNGAPITCFAQLKPHLFGEIDSQKRFLYAEIFAQEILGDVSVLIGVGGLKGAFFRAGLKEIVATKGAVYATSLYDINTCMYGNRPQSRTIVTQENPDPGYCNTCGVESNLPNSIDREFGLLVVWSGRLGITGYSLTAAKYEETTSGACEPVETGPRSLSEQGCSARSLYITGCAFENFYGTASLEVYCQRSKSMVIGVGQATSIISQADADRKARAAAQIQADQFCACSDEIFLNEVQRFTAYCVGVSGVSKTVIIPAGRYRSEVSQADADAQAYAAAREQAEAGLECPEPPPSDCTYEPIASYPDSSESWKAFIVQLTDGGDIEDYNQEYGALSPDAKRVVLGRFRSLLGPLVQNQVIDTSVKPNSPYLGEWAGNVTSFSLPDSRYYLPATDQYPVFSREYDFIGGAYNPDLASVGNYTWYHEDYDAPEVAEDIIFWYSLSENGKVRIGVNTDFLYVIRAENEDDFVDPLAFFDCLNYCGDKCTGSYNGESGFWSKTGPGEWEFTLIGRLPEWGNPGDYALSVNLISGDGSIMYGERIDYLNNLYYLVKWVDNVPTEVEKDQNFVASFISEDGSTVCHRFLDDIEDTMWDSVNGWRNLGAMIRAIPSLVPANASWFDEPYEGSYSQQLMGISGNAKFFLVRVVGPNFDEVSPLMYVCLGDTPPIVYGPGSFRKGIGGPSDSNVWGRLDKISAYQFPGDCTFQFWHRISSSPTPQLYGAVCGHGIAGSDVNSYRPTDNSFVFYFPDSVLYTSSGEAPTDTWNHWTVRREGTVLTLFKNGVQIYQDDPGSATPFNYFNTNQDFYFGKFAVGIGANDYRSEFHMSDFRMWNIARSDAEILADYQQRLAGNEAGLVAYYPMYETDSVFNDLTGNNASIFLKNVSGSGPNADIGWDSNTPPPFFS